MMEYAESLPRAGRLQYSVSTWTLVHPFGTFVANPRLHANPDPLGHRPRSIDPTWPTPNLGTRKCSRRSARAEAESVLRV